MSSQESFNKTLLLESDAPDALPPPSRIEQPSYRLADQIINEIGDDRSTDIAQRADAIWDGPDDKRYFLQRFFEEKEKFIYYRLSVSRPFVKYPEIKFFYRTDTEQVEMYTQIAEDNYIATSTSKADMAEAEAAWKECLETAQPASPETGSVNEMENERFCEIACRTIAEDEVLGRVVMRCLESPINTPVDEMFAPAREQVHRKNPTLPDWMVDRAINYVMELYLPN